MMNILTFLRNGGSHIKVGGFVLDVLSQSDDVLQLMMSLLQITFSHLHINKKTLNEQLKCQLYTDWLILV